MISSEDICSTIVLEITFNKFIHTSSNIVNNFNIVEIGRRVGPMSMSIGIATKQVEKDRNIILVEQLPQLLIMLGPVQKALKLVKRPLI